MRRRSHTPPSEKAEDVYYKNTRRMTELPQHSIQKYLSDREGRQQGTPPPPPPPAPPPAGEQGGKKEAVEGHHHHAKRHQHKDQAARHKEYRRVASAGPGPRRLSVCDSVTSKEGPWASPLSRVSEPETELYLLMSRPRLRDRRLSTPVMYLTESLNKLALSSLSNSSGDLDTGGPTSHIKSGHKEIQRVFSSDEETDMLENFHLNGLNCPNSSTTQCGCGLISCPCCNLLMNLEMTSKDY